MSMQTQINGFTTWANYRLQLVRHDLMDNVLTDFMRNFNLKVLVESFTGRPFRKLGVFDGLSDSQKETRIQWTADELKVCGIIGNEAKFDCRLITRHSFNHIVDLLWQLVTYDVEFLCQRSAFMRQNNTKRLITHPFSCTPPRPTKKGNGSGGGDVKNSKSLITERDFEMIYSSKKLIKPKKTLDRVFDLINLHLGMTLDGKKIDKVTSFLNILHVRIFCALVNSIIPDTFISDVLLNDAWTFKLIVQTISEIFRFEFSFSLDDLIETDNKGICCFFTFFFMSGYYLRQAKAAVERLDYLSLSILRYNKELSELKTSEKTGKNIAREEELKDLLKRHNKESCLINANYDVLDCRNWVRAINNAREKLWSTIGESMKRKYNMITMPMNLSVNELKDQLFVNLDITGCPGFYELHGKETITNDRKVIILHKETRQYSDYVKMHDGKKQRTSRSILGISSASSQEIIANDHSDYHIFLESLSSNKSLKAGSLFVYQIFPYDMNLAKSLLFKEIKNEELESVKNLVSFFQSEPSFVSGSYGNTKTTPLHLACKNSNFDIVLYLLEQNADVDKQNTLGNTPLHIAIENGQQKSFSIAKLLIEWGASINIMNRNKLKPLDDHKNKEFCLHLQELHDYWQITRPRLVKCDVDLIKSILTVKDDSFLGRLSTLRSRCANGDTLLHIAARHNLLDLITQFFVLDVDINVLNDEFETPLHLASSKKALSILIEYGGNIFLTDIDQNTPIHTLFNQKEVDCESIRILVNEGVDILQRNSDNYTTIHSAAATGKVNAIETLLEFDYNNTLIQTLNNGTDTEVPSVVYLALQNNHLPCAQWLLEHNFELKEREGSELVQMLLQSKIKCSDEKATFRLLFENGACAQAMYADGNNCLHLASTSIDMLGTLEQFIGLNCDVNKQNDHGWSALFFAANSDNYQAAAILIQNGADPMLQDVRGMTAFDYIDEYDHWVSCGLFDDYIQEMLHAYNLKRTRNLVRSITEKIRKSEL